MFFLYSSCVACEVAYFPHLLSCRGSFILVILSVCIRSCSSLCLLLLVFDNFIVVCVSLYIVLFIISVYSFILLHFVLVCLIALCCVLGLRAVAWRGVTNRRTCVPNIDSWCHTVLDLCADFGG